LLRSERCSLNRAAQATAARREQELQDITARLEEVETSLAAAKAGPANAREAPAPGTAELLQRLAKVEYELKKAQDKADKALQANLALAADPVVAKRGKENQVCAVLVFVWASLGYTAKPEYD
jgi:hypothetical protein